MPRTQRAPGKGPRAQKTAETHRAKVAHLAFRMEQPLDEAFDFVRALHLMGFGMMGAVGEGDERAIVTVSHAAEQRLQTAKDAWRGVIKIVGPRKASKVSKAMTIGE